MFLCDSNLCIRWHGFDWHGVDWSIISYHGEQEGYYMQLFIEDISVGNSLCVVWLAQWRLTIVQIQDFYFYFW